MRVPEKLKCFTNFTTLKFHFSTSVECTSSVVWIVVGKRYNYYPDGTDVSNSAVTSNVFFFSFLSCFFFNWLKSLLPTITLIYNTFIINFLEKKSTDSTIQSLNYSFYLSQMTIMLRTFCTDREHSPMRSPDGKKYFIDGSSIHFGLQTNVAYCVFSITFYRFHKLITQGRIQDSL